MHPRHLLCALALLGFFALAPSAQAQLSDSQILFLIKEVKPDAARVGMVWSTDTEDREGRISRLSRTAANLGVKLFLAEIENMTDVGKEFRTLTREHDVEVLWIVENSPVLNEGASKGFLIKNATKNGIPLLAPSSDWVDEGATITFEKGDAGIKMIVNRAGADATALTIPAKYADTAEFLAAN